MNIRELFNEKKLVYSLEIFPPKATSSPVTIYRTLEGLKDLKADFISVTYGAGGSVADNKTCHLSSLVKNEYNIEALAHLTCINSSKYEVDKILDDLKSEGIQNILALRGDENPNYATSDDFKYAYELISHIKKRGDFNIVAACYPNGHIDCNNLEHDIEHFKIKQDVGATHFVSQLFFDNDDFYNFLELANKKGINVPIQAGIMPVVNKKQIVRMSQITGTKLPDKFIRVMDKYEHDPIALRDAGIAYANNQIVDLIASGVDGIHLYTMNNPLVAQRITSSVSSLIESVNQKIVEVK